MDFWIHPFIQVMVTLVAIYVLMLGVQRMRGKYWGAKIPFAWKTHVRLGSWAIALWLAGTLFGLVWTHLNWGDVFITGEHALIGCAFMVLALFGFFSGRYMDKVKKRRTVLPLVHGVLNILLVLTAVAQIWTGLPFLP